MAGLSIGAALFGGSPWWALLAAAILTLSLNKFLFPSTYTIDESGIDARLPLKTQRLDWPRVRRFVHDEHGGYLSTRARRSWTDAYRGMHLQFSDDRGEQIEMIGRCIERARVGAPQSSASAEHEQIAPSARAATAGGDSA